MLQVLIMPGREDEISDGNSDDNDRKQVDLGWSRRQQRVDGRGYLLQKLLSFLSRHRASRGSNIWRTNPPVPP